MPHKHHKSNNFLDCYAFWQNEIAATEIALSSLLALLIHIHRTASSICTSGLEGRTTPRDVAAGRRRTVPFSCATVRDSFSRNLRDFHDFLS